VAQKKFKFDYLIRAEDCWDCATCVNECQEDAVFVNDDFRYEIDLDKCIRCAKCFKACPVEAIDKTSAQATA